jgi:ribonuclease BN (tRNA processing enzyme)
MPDRTLQLDCLGSGNAFSNGQYWSSYLLEGRVLLDCPPQTLVHLRKLDIGASDLDLVLLSHQHSDHMLGIDLLLLEAAMGETRIGDGTLPIVGPPGIYDRARAILGEAPRLGDRDDPHMPWSEQTDGTSFEVGDITVECVEVDHFPDFTALGYRIHIDGRTVAYTGDTKLCDAVYTLAEGADLLIAECGGGPPHMNWDDIFTLRAALPATTEILVTHYDRRRAPDVSDTAGLILAEDFARYDV